MLRKFSIIACRKQENDNNYMVGITPSDDENIALFFPIAEEDALVINFLIDPKENKETNPNLKLIGLYKTIADGFENSGTFISGVILDFESLNGEDLLYCNLCLSLLEGGFVENIMKTSFSNAITLAAMIGMDIMVTDSLIKKLMPEDPEQIAGNINEKNEKSEKPNKPEIKVEKKEDKKFPEDKNIKRIAKKIMNGKMKDK
jgi:ankyrin repeat protein